MSATPKRRVVVTGIGAVTPLGLTAAETWSSALEGKSGVAPITFFDTKDCPVTFAAEVKGFDVTRAITPLTPRPLEAGATPITQAANSKDARRVGRYVHLALSAALEAYADSGLDTHRKTIDSTRMGVNIGVGMGGLPEIADVHTELMTKGYKRITPFFIPQVIPNMASGQISILLNLQGPNTCITTACASSAHSIGESFRLVQRGDADIMVAGGAEAVISPLGIGGFAAMRALSTRNDSPASASRPFDAGRDGFVMGEGSAVLILEDFEHARKRGAKIYGEILGYGMSADAYHMTTPAPEGEGGYRAMKAALLEAGTSGIRPSDIGYVNAHGTSTPAGDAEEARAVAKLFSEVPGAQKPLVSSTKSMTGHLLGAAGAIEALFCLLAVRDSKVPPTINLENVDPTCAATGLDFVRGKMRGRKMRAALSNSFGFGGTNASLVVGSIGGAT